MGLRQDENNSAKADLLAALEQIYERPGLELLGCANVVEPGLCLEGFDFGNVGLGQGHEQHEFATLLRKAAVLSLSLDDDEDDDGDGFGAWKYLAHQVRFWNGLWDGFVTEVCTKASEGLGVEGGVGVLRKVLVLEDVMPTARMYGSGQYDGFATLVVHLSTMPSVGEEVTIVFCKAHGIVHVGGGSDKAIAECLCHDRGVGRAPMFLAVYSLTCPLDPRARIASASTEDQQLLEQSLHNWLDKRISRPTDPDDDDPDDDDPDDDDDDNGDDDDADQVEDHDYVFFELETWYPPGEISLKHLEGNDATRAQALVDASTRLPVDLFFACLEAKVFRSAINQEVDRFLPDGSYENYGADGSYGRYFDDDCFEAYGPEESPLVHKCASCGNTPAELHYYNTESEHFESAEGARFHPLGPIERIDWNTIRVTDLAGQIVKLNLHHEHNLVLQGNSLRLVKFSDPEDEEWPPHLVTRYTTTVIVIVPQESLLDTLEVSTATPDNDEYIIRYLAERWQHRARDKNEAFALLSTACEVLWTRGNILDMPSPTGYSLYPREAIIQKVLRIAAHQDDWRFFDTFLYEVMKHGSWDFNEVLGLLRIRLVKDGINIHGKSFHYGEQLERCISSYPSLSAKLNDIRILAPVRTWIPDPNARSCRRPSELDGLRTWGRDMMRYSFIACDDRLLNRRDAIHTFDLLAKYCDVEELESQIVPFIHRNVRRLAFSLTCLARLHKHTWEGRYEEVHGFALYRDLAHAFVEVLDVAALRGLDYRARDRMSERRRPGWFYVQCKLEKDVRVIDPADLADLVVHLVEFEMRDTLRLFSNALARGAKMIEYEEFGALWFPFRRILRSRQDDVVYGDMTQTPAYQSIFSIIDRAFSKWNSSSSDC